MPASAADAYDVALGGIDEGDPGAVEGTLDGLAAAEGETTLDGLGEGLADESGEIGAFD